MENKTKILTFAAVALMFAVCFIGFVAINDDAVDAEGETTNIAKIGETPYPTLIDAIKNVKNGETITLVRDVTDGSGVGIFVNGDGYIVYNAKTFVKEKMVLEKGEKLTLDLNGKTYCVTTPAVGSEGYETQAFHLEKDFNVTIKNGTITSSGSNVLMLVQNYCNLTLDNVTLDGSNLPGAKGYVLSNNFGNITITGNTQIIAPSNGVAFDLWYGMSSSYNDGVFVTFDEKFTGIVNGTIEYGAAFGIANGDLTKKAVLIINGSGTFKGDLKFSSNQITVADIKILSGAFTDIANAVKYATSGAAITLADDVEIPGVILVDKKITLDLNGHNIAFSAKARFLIKGGDLSIIGTGTISEKEPYYAPIMLNGSTENTANYSVVTVGKDVALIGWSGIFFNQTTDNSAPSNYGMVANLHGTIEYKKDTSGDTGAGIYVNGTIGSESFDANNLYPVINIYDTAKISGEGLGIYAAGYAKWTIDGANIEGTDCAIEIRAGELTIKDGSFKSTATEFSCGPNGNGSTTTGAAIAIAQHTTKRDITVNISGGTFEGLRALNEGNPQNNNDPAPQVNLSVTGGTFKGMIQSVDSIVFITGGSFSDLSGLAYVASGVTYNLVNDCTVDSDITVKAGTTLSIAKDVTLTTKGTITNKGVIDNKGTIINEGVITTVAGGINISGKLIMGDGSKLTVGGKDIIDGLKIEDGAILAINTNSKGGFDVTLNGKATASKLDVSINDTFTVAKGAELKMTGTFLNAGNVTIDGTLLMTDAGKLQVMKNGIVTINGTIDGGIIDITNVDKDVVCVLFKPNSTITSKIDGTDDGKTSIVVLFGIKAGKGGVSVTKGSVIVDGALVEGDVTVPSGSTSFVYGTLEPGATLTIENNAAVNPTGSGSLVVESGAKVVTNSGASIKSVTYKAGSELNGTTFDTDTRVTPEGNVLVAIKIYLNYDDKKLNVSADYVEAFAGDKYVDVLSGVTVSGVNSRITFSGWYNSLDEKITSDVVVPSGGTDVILTAHFTEKAKNTVVNTGSNDGVDYSVVIAFIVLIGSMVFLCSVLRKR